MCIFAQLKTSEQVFLQISPVEFLIDQHKFWKKERDFFKILLFFKKKFVYLQRKKEIRAVAKFKSSVAKTKFDQQS